MSIQAICTDSQVLERTDGVNWIRVRKSSPDGKRAVNILRRIHTWKIGFVRKRPPCEVVQDIEKYQQQIPEDSRSAFWQGKPHDQHHKPNKNEFVPSSKCGESRGCTYAIGYGEARE